MKKTFSLVLIGVILSSTVALAGPFEDVPFDDLNGNAISMLKELGIVKGDGTTGLFAPDRVLNRAEFAKMIVESKGWSIDGITYDENKFPDVPEGQWYTNYIIKANQEGVLQGTGEGKAEPGREVLMVEALTMTLRAFEPEAITGPQGITGPQSAEPWYQPYLTAGENNGVLTYDTILTEYDKGLIRAEAAQLIYNAIYNFDIDRLSNIDIDTYSYPSTENYCYDTDGFELCSSAFEDRAVMPITYTCDGSDISPPLIFKNIPEGTKSLAILMGDIDAEAPANIDLENLNTHFYWVHWLTWNIPVENSTLEAGKLPSSAIEGINNFDKHQYNGPCPPKGETHTYEFYAYALDDNIQADESTNLYDLTNLYFIPHILDFTTLEVTYSR